MIAVLDTNCFINMEFDNTKISKAYITESVCKEVRDVNSRCFLDLYAFAIEVRNPKQVYIDKVAKRTKDYMLCMSRTDVEVIALTLELKEELMIGWIDISNINTRIECITGDNGMKQALSLLNLQGDKSFASKTFMMRCYTCFALYKEKVEFCKKCGYTTITRVAVTEQDGEVKVHLKKGYKAMAKTVLTSRGKEIHSEDQREYKLLLNERKRHEQRERGNNLDFQSLFSDKKL